MTYASILEAYGWERFADDARAAGATSLIVADLPAGRPAGAAPHPARRADLDRRAGRASPPSRPTAGSTSSRSPARPARAATSPPRSPASSSARARATEKPLYAGFGISTPEHARAAAELADGIVVGSRAVEVAEEGPAALERYVSSLREAL